MYPNPVDVNAGIHFTLGKETLVDIRINNLTGEELINLGNETIPAGNDMREIPAGDLSSGVYLVRMVILGNVYTRKMLVN
jgi:hypothetical protein